jgi:hypothetical protein
MLLLDEAEQGACFWPDAEIDYGFFQGTGKDWLVVEYLEN